MDGNGESSGAVKTMTRAPDAGRSYYYVERRNSHILSVRLASNPATSSQAV